MIQLMKVHDDRQQRFLGWFTYTSLAILEFSTIFGWTWFMLVVIGAFVIGGIRYGTCTAGGGGGIIIC
jgi:hypothetical protein